MEFNLIKSIEILERTPLVIELLLKNLSTDWINANEGENTFSPYDVVGHFIHGEKTDWIPRLDLILEGNPDKSFEPYDRFAQLNESKGKSLDDLLTEFRLLREKNIEILKAYNLSETDYNKTVTHPALGKVSLKQLLSTWTVHDLSHIGQIVRVMSKQYKDEVGPWIQYLRILTK